MFKKIIFSSLFSYSYLVLPHSYLKNKNLIHHYELYQYYYKDRIDNSTFLSNNIKQKLIYLPK